MHFMFYITNIKMETMRKKGKLKEKKLQDTLTEDEVKKLFGAAESQRDELVLKLLYYTGMRVSEMINIEKRDINFKEDVIKIRAEITKTRQEANQPIPRLLKPFLESWCRYKAEEEKIIPLTKQRVWQLIKYYVKKVGIKKSIHPHSFRHTFGTHIYEKTGDLGKVQELLRHKSLSSTGIYKHLSKQLKKQTVDNVFT
jgi:integrase/recombinase XerD